MAIEATLATPPSAAIDGQCWIVGSGASGSWAGKDGQIACFSGGNWLFMSPRDGMRVLNREADQDMRYVDGWLKPARPAAPSGGTVIDSEARATISALISALELAGILPPS
ncbi:DUF2793 domain-containing protein [Novosphingobium sp. B 225]|uniref:DUF2793 domain-containing protein n=1 Tax=Novosphingobium sp. B 225 TaxID=1961849 RepID=UPI0020CC5F4D|nr:DUF2793 domain-containing protein [Novosphingobium sp. B 225]